MVRSRILKVLHVTYRFGEELIGGAEQYLWNLSRHLALRGVDITVATTTARDFRSPTRWNVFWTEGYSAGEEMRSGLRIIRFPFIRYPRWIAGLYGIALQRRFDREEWDFPPPDVHPEGGGILGRGWYFEEPLGGGLTQRWTGPRAEILICDENIQEVGFCAACPWENSGEVFLNGEKAGEFRTGKSHQYFAFKAPVPQRHLIVEVRLRRPRRPWRDLRKLGMVVTGISYRSGDVTKSIPLYCHYASALTREKDTLLDWLKRRALGRPARYCTYFDRARGPYSRPLLRYIDKNSRHFDLILGHDFPHYTLGAAVRAGKRSGITTVALPLAHLEDDYYHWRHYYDALASADVTFSLSDYSRDIFRSHFGANAHTLGGGIDLEEFERAEFDGDGFRRKYGLEKTPLILFVGRKAYPKRYDALIRAVRIVNLSVPCRLVMIGPDEDRQGVDSADALYLGPLDRRTILDAYDACDIFAMLSGSESFGMVFTEAWMRRKPVIGYRRCGAVASLISDGVDGFLCDADEEVARRSLELLENPDLRRRLGEAGRQKTLARFTWDKIATRAHALYEEVVAKRKG